MTFPDLIITSFAPGSDDSMVLGLRNPILVPKLLFVFFGLLGAEFLFTVKDRLSITKASSVFVLDYCLGQSL